MKSNTNFFKFKKAMRSIILILAFAFASLGFMVQANQIDIGIFASSTVPKKIEIRIRPDFNISSIQTVTGILYTVRWDDPAIAIATQFIAPFNLAPQGAPALYNGHYYQVFAAVPMTPMAMNANQEYLISTFTFTNGDCSKFEIIEDAWTQSHNGNVYLELVGLEVTGIIYHPEVIYTSIGGNIAGSDTTQLGTSTGPMTLTGYNGSVLYWERKVNEGSWVNIPGTAGLTTYSEVPPAMGDYYYRAAVQSGACPVVYSGILYTVVVANVIMNLTVFLEGPFQNTEMSTDLKNLGLVPLSHPYNASPWNYTGTESVISIPANAVDWVLVELRESAGDASTATSDKTIRRRAAFLMNDGAVKELDGIQNLQFTLSLHNNLYIAVFHRNHLSVITAVSPPILSGNCIWNFTSGETQALGGSLGHKQIAPGIWGMMAGDANSNGSITNTDKQSFWKFNAGKWGYISSDFSMDSQIDNKDKNDLWLPNLGKQSQVPN
jgi:hypothetical protein